MGGTSTHNRILFKVISLVALAITATELPAETIFLDGFELCRSAGVVEWDGGGDGKSWSDPLNWANDTRPVDGDAAAIRAPASLTVEYRDLTTTLECLAVTSSLLVSGGELILDGAATFKADLAIAGGTVTANAQMSVTGAVDLGLGNLQGTGTVTVHGPFNWTGGSQLGTGESIANGGLEISGAESKFLGERTLTLNAVSNWTGGGNLDLRFGAIINVDAPFDIATDADLIYPQGGPSIMNINGSLTKSAGNGLTTITAAFNNNGSIAVNSGQLAIGFPTTTGSSSGEFTVAADSVLTVSGNQTFDASSSFSGAGGLVHDGGTAVIQGAYNLTGPLGVPSGTLQFAVNPAIANDVSLTGGNLELQSGATITGNVAIESGTLLASGSVGIGGTLQLPPSGMVDGTGTVTVNGLFTWTGGRQFGTGESIANGGLEISGAESKFLRERTLTLNAASNWTGGGNLDLRFGAIINVDAPFDIATDADLIYPQGGPPIMNINGSLTKSAGVGNTEINADIGNSGAVAVSSGQLSFLRDYQQDNSGSLHVDIAGDADFNVIPVTGAATLDGTLEINLLGGYEPLLGQTFVIMTAASVTDEFATVNGTAIVSGRKFSVAYGANNVTLEVVSE